MASQHLLCTQCGSETTAPVKLAPGSPWVALVLAVPFVIPGVAYAVWRYTMRRDTCPTCGHGTLGWITGRAADYGARTPAEVRLDRIEQAIDAIAGEVDRVSQRAASLRGVGETSLPPRLRDRGTITPT